MDISRIIQVFIVQLGLGIVFLIIGIKVLKRDKKRLNQIISMFYFSIFIGMLINVIYAPLEIESIVKPLHLLTIFMLTWPTIFLLIFNLIILQSSQIIDTKKQIIYAIVFAVLLLPLFLLPNSVTINESTNWKPVWSGTLTLYLIIIFILIFIITINTGFKVRKAFKNELLRTKWNYYLIGVIANYLLAFITFISNYLNNDTIRLVISLVSLLLFIATSRGIYVGIGQQLQKQK